ncbi:MAG TPA: crosslink repair DNA glycosylase YcaQ family protein [Actinomycetota bacterium]|nr:crosslink repair DNA glycosylase YcaQ family protein [Actinomycetota bacterium]
MTGLARSISRRDARRAAIRGQLLARPRPGSIVDVVRGLGMVQLDPTAVVARTDHLVLFSRLGRRFRVEELERLLWTERELFEYWVHVVPTEDLPLHRVSMRRYPLGGSYGSSARRRYEAEWLRDNAAFRRYVLRELRARGPLRARDLEDRTSVRWATGGWNDGRPRHVAMMLDLLWSKGEVMIVGRDGQQRLWDVAERRLPDVPPLSSAEVADRVVERQLRAHGVAAPARIGWLFDGHVPGRDAAMRRMRRSGVAVPVRIDGLAGEWLAHADLLEGSFRGRTVVLSPFDDLISDRDRTQALFGFEFRLEIYVPKAKRRWGYFVLPILDGDRLIGRVDPRFDRRAHALHLLGIHAEPGATPDGGTRAAKAVGELAGWLGAERIVVDGEPPAPWRDAFGALASTDVAASRRAAHPARG